MFVSVDWNNIKTIKTHQSSAVRSNTYADHIIRMMARISRNKIMFRNEYLDKSEQIAVRLVGLQGLQSTMKAILARTGYGRIIGTEWEVKQWQVEIHPRIDGYYCHIYAMTAPFLTGFVCFSCKCELSKRQGYFAQCERCEKEKEKRQNEQDRRTKIRQRILRDEREAKELRSLTRELERCIREKSKRDSAVFDQHNGPHFKG